MTCKKTHQEEKAATGDVGITLFIWCWPGTAEGRPAPRSAASRGERGRGRRGVERRWPRARDRAVRGAAHLALPLRARSPSLRVKQRKLHN